MVYLFGSSPFVLFHHHENEIVTYEDADACQRAVYYGETDEDHHHSQHISKVVNDCPLCDLHTLTLSLPPVAQFKTFKKTVSEISDFCRPQFLSIYSHSSLSRGPPNIV